MSVQETIFSAVFNILSIYIDFRMIKLFLQRKKKPFSLRILIYFLVWSFNWGIYFFINSMYITTASLFLGLLFAVIILYEGSLIRKFVSVVSTIALGMISESITWRVLSDLKFNDNEALGSLLSSFLLMILVLILERFFNMDKNSHISISSYFNIIIIIVGSTVIGEILVNLGGDNQDWILLGLSVVCLMNVSIFYLYDKVNEIYFEKLERQAMEQKLLMYENQFELMQQAQKKIDSLRHDFKNHLLLLNSYLEEEKYEKALSYMGEIGYYTKVSGQYINTHNQEIDAILNYMIDKAEKISCKIETQIEVPDSPFMPGFDLNMLLSNLLDNAIEALEKTDEKYLFIGLKYQKGLVIIRIYNTFDGKIKKKGIQYITQKPDKVNHGIGMKNVKEIVEKYNGEQIIQTTDSLFKTDIVLYVKTSQ